MTHADYYTVTATIIPVLLLAATFQIRFYRAYLEAGRRALGRRMPHGLLRILRIVISAVAILALLEGAIAEIAAVLALQQDQDTAAARSFTLTAIALLLLVTCGGLGIEMIAAIYKDPSKQLES